MSSAVQLFDVAGRRRSPATLPDFHAGNAPANKGQRYAADPPTVDEIIAIMRHAQNATYGNRLNGLIVVLWRAGLRINEALSLTETDRPEAGEVCLRRRRALASRPDRERGRRRRRCLLAHASESQVRLQVVACHAGGKRTGIAIATNEGSRRGRSQRRTVEGVEMRTYGESQARERRRRRRALLFA